MSKILVVIIHPDMANSKVNKRWAEELQKYPERFVLHDLHAAYPDGKIDVAKEQALIEQYDKIVFQFPFYWFSSPGLFKTWQDDVLTHGWAYGSKSGYKMQNKQIALAMSAGVDEDEYQAGERYRFTVEELTRPFQLSFEYVRADYRPFFMFYGMEFNGTEERVEEGVKAYMDYLETAFN